LVDQDRGIEIGGEVVIVTHDVAVVAENETFVTAVAVVDPPVKENSDGDHLPHGEEGVVLTLHPGNCINLVFPKF
jgi:hypothetical protein